ncbi:uncharacterized protein H6S33_013141 [Morchella sextelata]|uniref:uncharacterized protein n=1 Tax=Morchella sextelata TaxID=1174677 RepID=UPI001D04A654|nr:uncharacterized protein H6S33_013141 [Morchella sextelata]KAH0609655.1 hypothetical protein H6S33_013141 [Morchella sextelata]
MYPKKDKPEKRVRSPIAPQRAQCGGRTRDPVIATLPYWRSIRRKSRKLYHRANRAGGGKGWWGGGGGDLAGVGGCG